MIAEEMDVVMSVDEPPHVDDEYVLLAYGWRVTFKVYSVEQIDARVVGRRRFRVALRSKSVTHT